MTMRIVSHSDDVRLHGRSLEKKSWFMGRFIISHPRLSFDSLLKYLDKRNEVETVLRLSDKGISWGKQGSSWWRPWHRTLPFALVELSALHDIFQESSQPQVLICVESPVRGARDSNYQVFAFRLYDVDDVRRFQRLFQLLTNAGGPVTDAIVRLDSEERSPNARLVVRPSLEPENRTERVYGDRIRHGSRKKNRNFDPNNNAEKADGRAGNHQTIRSFSVPPTTTPTNRLEYRSPQPVRRNNGPPKTSGIAEHQVIPETVPTYAVVAPRTERLVPANGRKVIKKSWSEDEDAKRTELDLTWTRNSLFGDKVASPRDGVASNYAAGGGEPPKPMPRTRIGDQETQVKSYVISERSVSPTQVKSYGIPERTVSPTQVTRERTVSPTQVIRERTVSPTQVIRERTVSPTQVIREKTASPTQVESYVIPERTVSPTQVRSYFIPERTVSPTQVIRERTVSPTQVIRERTVSPTQVIRERTVSPTQVIRERTVSPTQFIRERTVSPTQVKSRIGSSDNTSERSITPTQLERAISPSGARGHIPQSVEIISDEGSHGIVRVHVPDYQKSPVVPHKSSLHKSRKDLDPEPETTNLDSGRQQRKSLSFNPSVVINGTTGNSLTDTESPDQPGMDVTVHRIFQNRHTSWSDSEGPDHRSTVRKRVVMRGLSLPTGEPAPIAASGAVRIRSTTDPTTTDSKPHALINGHHGPGANHDHTPLDKREQVSEKFRKVRVVPSGSIPVDVITEEEDRQYDRRPGLLQSTTHAVRPQSPDQPKGSKKGNKTSSGVSSKVQHRRMGYFGRRSGEPPIQYASDSEESARSRSMSHIILGQGTRRGVQVVHQNKSPAIVGGGGHPSMAGQTAMMPNGRLEVRVNRVSKEDEKGTAVLKEGVERGKDIGREDVRRGRATEVRDGRRREVDDEIRYAPATHDRHSDPVGRLSNSRRSRSVFDPRGGPPPVIYNPDIAPPNGYLPGQLVIRSRSATRPILLSRTVSHENGTVQLRAPVGQSAGGGHQGNDSRKINHFHQSDQTTPLHNGGVAGRYKRKSNYF